MIKTRFTINDVAFWIFILATIAVILWLLSGSPTLESGLIAVGVFLMSSLIFLYRKYSEAGKKVALGFAKVKNDLSHIKRDIGIL